MGYESLFLCLSKFTKDHFCFGWNYCKKMDCKIVRKWISRLLDINAVQSETWLVLYYEKSLTIMKQSVLRFVTEKIDLTIAVLTHSIHTQFYHTVFFLVRTTFIRTWGWNFAKKIFDLQLELSFRKYFKKILLSMENNNIFLLNNILFHYNFISFHIIWNVEAVIFHAASTASASTSILQFEY